FVHLPLIVITQHDSQISDILDSNMDIDSLIDARPLQPVSLIVKSINRELSSQHNKYLYHQINSLYKNEKYRFDAFLKHTEDGAALIHDGKYISTNQAYKRLFKIPSGTVMANSPVLEFSSSANWPTETAPNDKKLNTSLESLPDETIFSALIQTRESDSFVTTLYKTHCFVDDQLCTQILVHNPDAWSNIDKGFTDLRTFDHETGLYNKRFTHEIIQKELSKTDPHGSLAIILIDDFRTVRDQHNLDYVDDVIRTIAAIINKISNEKDILARYSDAAFTLFSTTLSRSEFLLNCQMILTDVTNSLFGNDKQYRKLSMSIGVSFVSNKVTTAEQLVSQADKACDKANAMGGNQIHVFDSVTTPLTVIIDEEKNTQLIQSAIEHNRFNALYQPIVDLSEKNTENYAVLLRIVDEKNFHIPPDNFILTAEKTGLISYLDEWVIKNSIKQIKQAMRQGLKRKFFITLSNVTYRNEVFIENLVKEIKQANINASLLVFQINFTDVKTDPTVLKNFVNVMKKECHCQIAFDQIGFSQITDSILKEYSVDYVKIDGTFSQNLLNNETSKSTIQNILTVTQRNNVKTIAKSVENANTLALLWNMGVDAVQGYFLQKPSARMHFDFDLDR
ncbi:MAG: EAL domain-containing protein, partial [Cycloclasticus sp.]|nr:EAL domain-containing protein [Cycloclasticus sp.]MBQ0790443.1 EAL domain-containing protein [Cycloclasticus sp.]